MQRDVGRYEGPIRQVDIDRLKGKKTARLPAYYYKARLRDALWVRSEGGDIDELEAYIDRLWEEKTGEWWRDGTGQRVSRGVMRRVMQEADRRIGAEILVDETRMLDQVRRSISQREMLYQRALRKGDVELAHRIVVERDKLLNLYPAKKIDKHVTGQLGHVMVQCDANELLRKVAQEVQRRCGQEAGVAALVGGEIREDTAGSAGPDGCDLGGSELNFSGDGAESDAVAAGGAANGAALRGDVLLAADR